MCDVLSAGVVKTRKPHKCWGCTREFPAGTELARVTGKDGGVLSTAYWCDDCTRVTAKASGWGDECWGFGEVAEYARVYGPSDERTRGGCEGEGEG